MDDRLLSLAEATARLRPFRRRYVGVVPIDVVTIIGTADRQDDFDRQFTALRPNLRARQEQLARAFPDGGLPPIMVEKLGDAHFVVDGHHRVALARRRGMVSIDAEVTESTARWHLSAAADAEELLHAEQERLFMSESGLAAVLPQAQLRFSRAVGYRQLLETVEIHGYKLMLGGGRPVGRSEVAADWYSNVYGPAIELLGHANPIRLCANATLSDAFLWLWEQHREFSVEHPELQVRDALRASLLAGDRQRRRRTRFAMITRRRGAMAECEARP